MTDLIAKVFIPFILIICCADLAVARGFLKTDHANKPLEEILLDDGIAPQVKSVGCYQDQSWDRTFQEMYKDMRGFSTSEIIMGCAQAAVAKGFVYFGIQYGGECWGGKDGHLRYDIHGPASNCENGIGASWSNYVYRIEKVEGYCVTQFKLYKYNALVNDTCTCVHVDNVGVVVCKREICPHLPLGCEKQLTLPGQICNTVCACYHNNTLLKEGDSWYWKHSNNGFEGCEDCYCSNNQAVCNPTIRLCPICSTEYVEQPGKCCRACASQPVILLPPITEEPVLTLPWPPV